MWYLFYWNYFFLPFSLTKWKISWYLQQGKNGKVYWRYWMQIKAIIRIKLILEIFNWCYYKYDLNSITSLK